MNPKFLRSALLLLGLALGRAHAAPASPALTWHESSYDRVLGTSLELKFEAASAADAALAEAAALAEIDRVAAILSGYDPKSEFSRWAATRGEPVPVSPELFDVLALFDTWRERTGGALNASAETASQLWQAAARRQAEPTAEELQRAASAMNAVHWRLDPANRTAAHLSAAPLRLNSFAKSYIIDRACDAALATGRIASAVVNIGGDLVIRGRSPDLVGIADPEAAAENDAPIAHLQVRDRAIATSGGYRRGVTIGGRWFSHLIDPRNALAVDHVRSATVVSRSATEAGALATALCVMSAEERAALAGAFPGVEYLLVLADGSRVSSAGWKNLEAPAPLLAASGVHAAAAAAPSKPAEASPTEVLIDFELAAFGGGRAKRPFVAVWLEDKDHFSLRTVALWFKGSRWLPDLRSWARAEHIRGMAEGPRNPESLATATRGPGKYSLRWDGRDDYGKVVAPGRYTLMIEVAREHGTHQLVTREIDTTAGSARVELPANTELAAVSVEVRRASGAR